MQLKKSDPTVTTTRLTLCSSTSSSVSSPSAWAFFLDASNELSREDLKKEYNFLDIILCDGPIELTIITLQWDEKTMKGSGICKKGRIIQNCWIWAKRKTSMRSHRHVSLVSSISFCSSLLFNTAPMLSALSAPSCTKTLNTIVDWVTGVPSWKTRWVYLSNNHNNMQCLKALNGKVHNSNPQLTT